MNPSSRRITFLFFFFSFALSTSAQDLFTNTNFQKAVDRGTRTLDGAPGKDYWQNRANYSINVTFDPATQLLSGKETIHYFNNSADTLTQIIVRLYPDLYKKGVERLSRIEEKDLNDGVKISSFQIGDETISIFSSRRKAYHSNTNLYVIPEKPILPHDSVQLHIDWNYKVNTGSQVRTGMVDSNSYFIAYFFPRIAVYDDIDGWDTWSYNGSQEFYNDFGNFDVSIEVPKNYVVWATGDRLNASENFSESVLKRIGEASSSDKIIRVIDSTDYTNKNVFRKDASGVWKFHASNVTDFAIALSNHYLWDASSVLVDSATGRRSVAEAVFNRQHLDYYDVANQAHQTVYYTSHYYPKYPFPFSHITVFDGTDQMEYPMMVNDNPTDTHKDAVQLTTHEIFHSYFPFFMGTNETQYAWMDEGWATIGESMLSPLMGEPEDDGIFSKTRFVRVSGTDQNVPLITNTKIYSGLPYLANSYGKGGVCYYVLQELLGDSLYFKALHHYMNTWNGKHPTPYDFFYSINAGSGKNLNWFWKKWFFGWDYPEMAIKSVKQLENNHTEIVIENKGGLPLPVKLEVLTRDGRAAEYKHSPIVWENGNDSVKIVIPTSIRKISTIQLGSDWIPDKDQENNIWRK